MLVPCIDLQGGKVVQLVQGERLALEFDRVEPFLERFSPFPLINVIDLDAAKGGPSQTELTRYLCRERPCRLGGGIRNLDQIESALEAGASEVIMGSSLFCEGVVNVAFLREIQTTFPGLKLCAAVDVKEGKVAVNGWRNMIELSADQAIQEIEPFAHSFLCTDVDREGRMQGARLDFFMNLAATTSRKLIAAGGITTQEEVNALDHQGIDAAVGMAVYTGRLSIEEFYP